MATSTINYQCSLCNEQNDTYPCRGCSKCFCFNHLLEHREKIKENFHQMEHNYNQFQQNMTETKNHSNQHPLIDKINQWEQDSIEKIKQTADECKQILIKYLDKFIIDMENKFKDLFEQLKQINKENRYNEIDFEELRNKLNKLQEELDKPSDLLIKEETSDQFINKIRVLVLQITKDTKWKQSAITVAGGNGQGDQLNQLNCPFGTCIDNDQTIYISDDQNHRIVEWKSNATSGAIVVGNPMNRVSLPSDVIIDQKNNSLIIFNYGISQVMEWSLENNTNNGQCIISNVSGYNLTIDKNSHIYVCDVQKDEVRRWKRGEKEGTLVAGGNGKGNQLNQLSHPRGIFVDGDLSLYVSDQQNHRVMKWIKDAKHGIVVAGGNGMGKSLKQLSGPEGLFVDQLGQIYVADCNNKRVMRWCEGDTEGSIVVGGNGSGNQSNQLACPHGLFLDRQGNLYVSDSSNHRLQKFEID